MLYLDVPYEEKDKVKNLGARWDTYYKKWFVSNPLDYYMFKKWINGNVILSNCFYLVEGKTHCWRCKRETKVIAIGVESIIEVYDEPSDFKNDSIHIASGFESLPKDILKYLEEHYAIRKRYSKMRNSSYLSNGCKHCDALQGDWFLYQEPDSPFFINDEATAKDLILYRIKLDFDFPMHLSVGYGSEDRLIKQFATIIDFKVPSSK